MVSHWSLSDNKSLQVSPTLLSILANLNNAVVWMVSIRPVISKYSSPCTNNPLVTVPRAPITIGIIVTFMFHSLFNSLARSRYLSLFPILSISLCSPMGHHHYHHHHHQNVSCLNYPFSTSFYFFIFYFFFTLFVFFTFFLKYTSNKLNVRYT